MSEMSRNARRAMRAKIHRITQATSGKVDASDYGPEETIDAGVKTGLRPVSRRAFKKGGKVVANEGKDAVKHAGKKPRAGGKPLSIDALVNRNVKDANEAREGTKHIGGLKTGGRAKAGGGPLSQMGGDLYGMKNNPNPNKATALNKGGRTGKDNGGVMTGAQKAAQDAALKAAMDRMAAKKPVTGRSTSGEADMSNPPPLPPTNIVPGRRKSGGKVKKAGGGEMVYRERRTVPKLISDMYDREDRAREAHLRTPQGDAERRARNEAMIKGMNARKAGGKVWEGSTKDEAQDKKLAKKHGMSMKKWETSSLDKKHDKQHSTKGLKRGGMTSLDGEMQTQEKVGGRIAKRGGGSLSSLELASGGRAKKSGKTNINIIIGTGQKPQMGLAPGMPQPPGGGIPVPVPPAGAGGPPPGGPPPGGMPMGMPMGMPPAGGPPPMPMPMPPAGGPPMGRKRGGRAGHYDYGSGGGKGRLEKIDEYGEKQKK